MWQKIYSYYISVFKKIRNTIRHLRLDRRVVMFLVFFFISTFLWFVLALNKSFITEMKLSAEFSGTYDSLTLRNNSRLSKELKVQIEGEGKDIFRRKIRNLFSHPYFELANLQLIPVEPQVEYYFYTNTLKNSLQLFLGQDVKVLEVKPDTLSFLFTRYIRKNVFIKSSFKLNLAAGYALKQPILIQPNQLTIYGPDYIVNKIDSLEIEPMSWEALDKEISQKVKINIPSRVKSNVVECEVVIKPEEFTEIAQKLDIKASGVPDSLSLIMFPSQVNLLYKVFVSDYKKIKAQDFSAYVEYSLGTTNQKYLEVFIHSQPANVFDVRFTPQFIEYLIEEKNKK